MTAAFDEASILSVLDAACARGHDDRDAWPRFHHDLGERAEFAGLRLLAARAADGSGWGVALSRLSGGGPETWRVETFLYGSAVPSGLRRDLDVDIPLSFSGECEDSGTIDGAIVDGPAGRLELTGDLVDALDLRPGEGSEDHGGGSAMVALRAYLELYPDGVWPDPAVVAAALGLGGDAHVLVCVREFEHVAGRPLAPEDRYAYWAALPSESLTYRSLAEALCAGDGARFVAGSSNTSWRDHVSHSERLDDAAGHHAAGMGIGAYDDWDDAPVELSTFDGDWRCDELGLLFRLRGCEATTALPQADLAPGEVVLRITRVAPGGAAFAGQLRFSQARVCAAEGRLVDDDTLEMEAATHTFVMRRELSWSFS